MPIWPFRSRPVVTPFTDDFAGRVHSFQDTYTAKLFTVTIPDNIYLLPTSIVVPVDAAAGIRSTTGSDLLFSRGGINFAGVHFGAIASNQVQNFILADYGDDFAPVGAVAVKCYQLPKQLYLYPDDLLSFDIDSWAAGDVIGPIVIHGRFWEIH